MGRPRSFVHPGVVACHTRLGWLQGSGAQWLTGRATAPAVHPPSTRSRGLGVAVAGPFAPVSSPRPPLPPESAADPPAPLPVTHEMLCERCHADGGRRFEDREAKAPGPILAGQWLQYLLITFNEFIARQRPFPAGMDEAFRQLKRGDAEALAHYYASRP